MLYAKKGLAAMMSAVVAVAFTMVFVAAQPQKAEARTVTGSATYYVSNGAAWVSSFSSKKIVVGGTCYKGSGWASVNGPLTFKTNAKTKYRTITSTETGATKKISRKKAKTQLRSGNFITAQFIVKGGKLKKVTFGAW